MAKVTISMDVYIDDDAVDEFKKITHHIDRLIDVNEWPEISSISNVQVIDEDNKGYRPIAIHFSGRISNGSGIFINTITFRPPVGDDIVVDRRHTRYLVNEENIFEMTWSDCYIWDGVKENFNFPKNFKDYKIVSIDIDDEAPLNYEINPHSSWWYEYIDD